MLNERFRERLGVRSGERLGGKCISGWMKTFTYQEVGEGGGG